MRSYLSLIPIAEKKHKKQSRMTRLCIILAVFLVTGIFSMADMEMQSQLRQTIRENGYWHVSISHISEADAASLEQEPYVDFVTGYGAENYRLDQNYTIDGKKTAICAFDYTFQRTYPGIQIEGNLPIKNEDVVVSKNLANNLQKDISDKIILSLPDGRTQNLNITGIIDNTDMLLSSDCYGIGVSIEGLKNITNMQQGDLMYYVAIDTHHDIRQSIDQMKNTFQSSTTKIGENIKLLGIKGKSRDSYMMQLYVVAGVLAILVITAGVLMITSNINSNLSKRTEFFGMLRCLGATTRQIKTFVILEALSWCKTAIPIGVLSATIVSQVLCGALRFLSPIYFADMPILAISGMGIITGCIVGIITVVLAAISPARRASRVSPLTAVSGNAYSIDINQHKMHIGKVPVEIRLGIHHAYKSKKNFLLMVSSFALSIILFLAFSTGIDFLHHALKPLKVYTPDISVYTADYRCEISKYIVSKIQQFPGVKKVFGRSFAYDIRAQQNGINDIKVNVLSYEENQFQWSRKKVIEGNIDQVIHGGDVMTVFDASNPLNVGDTVTLNTSSGQHDVTIGAILSDSPFSREDGEETIIASEQTFEQITGENHYTIIDVQLTQKATDETVENIHALFPQDYVFSDKRTSNESAIGAYLSMAVFIYGFIMIIALISVFQVINSIAMSVNARIHQYGAMRAIGASTGQLGRMILAESVTYGLCGMLAGAVIGVWIHRVLYLNIITSRWGDAWRLPLSGLLIILFVITCSCLFAAHKPMKEIYKMSIVDTLTTF